MRDLNLFRSQQCLCLIKGLDLIDVYFKADLINDEDFHEGIVCFKIFRNERFEFVRYVQ